MNSADERLRAAARTAADVFPRGGDLPPLGLAERAPDHLTHIGPAYRTPSDGPRRVRAWAAPLAAAAAVIAVVSALVVPHLIAGDTGHRKPASHVPPATSPASRQKQRIDALVVQWVAFATGPQYDQGTRVIWLLHAHYQQATARCMAAAGYHIGDQTGTFSMGEFADNTQMPDLPLIHRTHEFVPTNGISGPTSYPPAEQRALSACAGAGQPSVMRMLRAYSTLSESWWKVVTRAQTSRQVRAALPALQACATRYGVPDNPYGPAAGPIKAVPDFMDWVSGFLDGAGSRGASQHTMNALDRHWTSVFVSCATPVVSIYQRMLISAQPGFLHQHARQLATLDELVWRDLVRRHS
jgi:hypothetical protein